MTSKISSVVYPRDPMILHSVLIICMKLMGTSFFCKATHDNLAPCLAYLRKSPATLGLRTVDDHITIDGRIPVVFFDFPEVFHEELACLSRLRVTSDSAVARCGSCSKKSRSLSPKNSALKRGFLVQVSGTFVQRWCDDPAVTKG